MRFTFNDTPVEKSDSHPDLPVGARMAVLGVGGAGGNAVSRMIDEQLPGVDFIVANTDLQALERLRKHHGEHAPAIVAIGQEVTRGLGSGGRPEVGRLAIEESLEDVMATVAGNDLLFIAAGMGGGTGTGAAPVIARRAREMGILTIAIVSTPFAYEARRRMAFAEEGVAGLTASADTVIVVPNAKLDQIVSEDTSFREALKFADSVLLNATRGISGILVRSGEINTDFADIRTIMGGGGRALLGYGLGRGEDAASAAAAEAMGSPLLDGVTLSGATRLLVNVRASGDLGMSAINQSVSKVQKAAHPDAEVIFGMDFDRQMGGDVAVTIIATGFEPDVANLFNSGMSAGTETSEHTQEAIAEPARDPGHSPASTGKRRSFLKDLLRRPDNPANTQTGLSSLPSRPAERPSYVRADD